MTDPVSLPEAMPEKEKSRFNSIKTLGRNRLFLVFLSGDIIIGLAFAIIDYPLIVYLLSLGFGLTAIGQLTSAGYIAALISQMPVGMLSHRIERKSSIMFGLCLYAVFPIFYPLSNTYLAFLAIAVLSGIAFAFLIPASFAFVGEIVPAQSRATATTLAYFVSGILTLGPFFGLALYLANKALPFVTCSLLTIVTICIFGRYIKSSKKHETTTHEQSIRIGARNLAMTFKRSLIGISIANLAYSFGSGLLFLLGFIYIVNILGGSLLLIGSVLIIIEIVSLVLSLFIAQLMDKTKKRKAFLILGLLAYGVAALAFTLVSNAFEAILVWTFLTAMGLIIGSSASTLAIETSEKTTLGATMSVYTFFGTAGVIISLQLVGYLQEVYNSFQKPFLLVSLSCIWAVIIAWLTVEEKPSLTKKPWQDSPE